MASKLAALNAIVAAETVPSTVVKTAVAAAAPPANANDVVLTDGSTVANVQNDSAPTKPAPAPRASKSALAIEGFSWTYSAGGTLDDSDVKATVVRDTTNPWYDVVVTVAKQKAGYLKIVRDADSKEKAPTSKLWSAILRAQKLEVKQASKLTVKSGTEKGVWFLVHKA